MGGLSLDLSLSLTGGASAAVSAPDAIFAVGSRSGAYYDIQDLSSLFQNSNGTTAAVVGQPVGYVADLSGNGFHLIQATAAARPTLRQDATTLLYYLERDGVDDTMASAASVTLDQSVGAYLGAGMETNGAFSATTNYSMFGLVTDGSSRFDLTVRAENPNHLNSAFARFDNGTQLLASGTNQTVAIGEPYLQDSVLDADSLDLFIKDESGSTTTGTSAGALTAGTEAIPVVLSYNASTGNSTRFYRGIIVADTLTAGEKTSIRTWLGEGCNVTI